MKLTNLGLITALLTLLIGFTFFASPKLAAVDVIDPVCSGPISQRPDLCKDNNSGKPTDENPLFGPKGIVTRAVTILSTILGIVAVFVLIVSGVRFITSAGNQQTVSSVRSQIIYAIVGLAVAASAQILVLMVLKKL